MKKLVYEKVPGQANPADLFTHGVGREKLQQFARASGQTFLDGRAQTSLQAQGGSKVSKLAHAEFMQIGIHTDEQIPRRSGRRGVVDWAAGVGDHRRPCRGGGTTCSDVACIKCRLLLNRHIHALCVIVSVT